MTGTPSPAELVRSHGGRYAAALAAAKELGYLRHGRVTAETALSRLQQAWANDGQAAQSFADFEAALVRVGLRLRRADKRKALPSPASGRGAGGEGEC